MTNIEALITLARHYCMNNYNFWVEKYEREKSGKMYSDSDYNLFPRYNAISAMLGEILMIVGNNYETIEDCKKELIIIGEYSQNIFTENSENNIELNAIKEEKEKFVDYIMQIQEKDLHNVIKLPYIRKLNKKESENIWNKLKNIWNYDGTYWKHSEDRKNIIFLMEKHVTENDKYNIIEYILKKDSMFYNANEIGNVYETEIIDFDCSEEIYTNKNYDWIIYKSHEMYMAFGGKMLLDYLNILFSDREEKINKYEW